ncbi:MAG: DUF3987 domain-containing protein [Bacteroidales bacterium]|nr:DUF3987 domain-containing protein [Bacteroidales bacterium]
MIIAEIKNKKDYLESQFLKLRFPVVLRQLLDCTPSKRRPGIFMSLMPIMSLYCNRLRLQYPLDNGKVTAPVVQCYVYGSSAAGKGKVEEFQTLLAAKLSEMDSKERAEEEAFLAKKRESSSKKKLGTPPDTSVFIFPEKVTSFIMVQRGLAATRRFGETLLQYQFTAELKSIISAHKGDYIDIDTLLLKCYDYGSLLGAETGNVDASRGFADVNMSVCYCSTEFVLNEFFSEERMLSGVLNRAILIPFVGKRLTYRSVSDTQKSDINHYLDVLFASIFNADGTLKPVYFENTDFLTRHVENFFEHIDIIVEKPLTKAGDTIEEFSIRASVNAFRIAAICLHLYKVEQAENNTITNDEIERNVVQIYRFAVYYILNNTLFQFGAKHDDAVQRLNAMRAAENDLSGIGLYDFMDWQFSFRDLARTMSKANMVSDPKHRISQWKTWNMITETDVGQYEKIPIEEHKAHKTSS